nr:hypothetical protein [Neisseria meningitidis]
MVLFELRRGNAVLVFVNPLYLQTLPERINPDSHPLRHSRESGNPVRWVSVISDKLLPRCISRFPLSRE